MNATHVKLIIAKELRELVRDARTLALLIVVPALLYPLLMLGAGHLAMRGQGEVEDQLLHIDVIPPVSPEVEQALQKLPGVSVEYGMGKQRDLSRADVTVRTAPPYRAALDTAVIIEVDGASERGLSAGQRVRQAIEEARDIAVRERVAALLPELPLEYGVVDIVDTAPEERRGAFVLSRLLAPLLLMMIVLGAFYPAVDSSVGERERQTLRTLLASPIHPHSIACGKVVVVTLVALLAASANLLGFGVTLAAGLAPISAVGEASLGLTTVVALAVILVPLSLYVAALLLAAASFARTTKEAQVYLTPLLLVLTLPAAGAVLPGVEATWQRALIPVYGPALAVREVLAGSASWSLIVAATLGAAVIVIVTTGLAARAFTTEALLTGRVSLPLRRPGPLEPFDAGLLLLAVSAALVVVAGFGAHLKGAASIVVPQLVVFVGLPLLIVGLRSTTPAVALGLRRPARGSGMAWLGALLLAPTVAAVAERLSRALFVLDDDTRHMFESLLQELTHLPAPWLFVLLALLPAVAEELCFRGAILGAFTARPWLGVLLSSVAFSAMHGALLRALPTVLLGLLAGLLTLRARSVFPAMTLHLWHNGLALIVAAWVGAHDGDVTLSDVGLYDVMPAWVYLVGTCGLMLFARGLWVARRFHSLA